MSSDEDSVESRNEEPESEDAESGNDFVFADLNEHSSPSTITFISDEQVSTVAVQAP